MPLQYELKRLSRHKRVFTSSDVNNASCYEIETRSLKDAILSRPDILIKESHGSQPPQTISSITFPSGLDEDNTFRPQISLKYTSENQHEVRLRTTAKSSQWSARVGGSSCVWDLSYEPFTLTLRPADSGEVLAVFTLRARGEEGVDGDIGSLCITSETGNEEYKKEIISTLAGVFVYWERAGKLVPHSTGGVGDGDANFYRYAPSGVH
ncbi:hypothetical protein DL98DRAFT_512866 [Cadophora sp. DSE1049]|nr:hypothetical protein DL98DRAFT_512866 [Cadophora sp. DSE1049]